MGKLVRRLRVKADYVSFLGLHEWPVLVAGLGAHYIHVPNRGTILVSDEMDGALQTQDFTVGLDEEPNRLPSLLKATAPHVLPIRTKGTAAVQRPGHRDAWRTVAVGCR